MKFATVAAPAKWAPKDARVSEPAAFRTLLAVLGLPLSDVADVLGVTPDSLSAVLQGELLFASPAHLVHAARLLTDERDRRVAEARRAAASA